MRTSNQLSKAYLALQEEAMEKIKSFFKGKPYMRIVFDPIQKVNIHTGYMKAEVVEVQIDGTIILSTDKFKRMECNPGHDELLPVDSLLIILDELERMKKANLLKKP